MDADACLSLLILGSLVLACNHGHTQESMHKELNEVSSLSCRNEALTGVT